MISWIQRALQNHLRLIFALLLIVMVIPFIFTIGSTPGIGRADKTVTSRDFFGHNLLSQTDGREITESAEMSVELQYGTGATPEQLEPIKYQRAAALYLADQLHLPAATPAEVTDLIQHLRVFQDQQGQFDNARYEAFRTSMSKGQGLTQDFIYRVLADDVRIRKVERLLAGPGFVLPGDVSDLLKRGETSWTVETGTVDYAGFDSNLTVSEPEISKFFTDNAFRYTIQPKVDVDAAVFPSAVYAAQAKADAAEVRKFYDANPARFPKPAPAKGAVAAKPDPAADYAAVEPQVRQALLIELGHRAAVKAASDLAYALYEGKVTPDTVAAFLASHQVKTIHLAPFTQETGPAELPGSHEIATAAFELSPTRFYSEGIPAAGGAVVLFWHNSIPARNPTLAEVHDKVKADALDAKKRQAFVDFGKRLQAGTTAGLRAGKTFEQAATAAAGSEKIAFKTLPPFTLRTPPKDADQTVLGAVEGLTKGAVSPMDATADKGIIVYCIDEQVPDTSPTSPRYQQLRAQLAGSYAQTTESTQMREIIGNELERSQAGAK